MDRVREFAADRVFAKVLLRIKPSKREVKDMIKHVNNLTATLAAIVPRDVELHVAGSIARGTNLKGDADIDIFMLFNKAKKKEKILEQGLEYGKQLARKLKGKWEVKYAEHAYIRVYLGPLRLKADLVPAFKIDDIEEMGTSVDRTPLHTKFINSKLGEKQRDDIRILKYMLKSHGIYGAEVKTNGFSGYLCELLVYNYGSLLKLLESAADFRLPLVINPKDGHAEQDKEVLVKRFNSNFVVVDPVDRNRNVAAGVSLESLSRFVIVARAFVSEPSEHAFLGHVNKLRYSGSFSNFMKQSGLDSFLIETSISDKSDDVVFPQLRKISYVISEHAERFGFGIYSAVPFVSSKNGYILILASKANVKVKMIKGPDAFIAQAASSFIKAHMNGYGFVLKGSALFALDYNRYETLEKLLDDVVAGKLIKNSSDVRLGSSKLYVNRIPKGLGKVLILELEKKLLI